MKKVLHAMLWGFGVPAVFILFMAVPVVLGIVFGPGAMLLGVVGVVGTLLSLLVYSSLDE